MARFNRLKSSLIENESIYGQQKSPPIAGVRANTSAYDIALEKRLRLAKEGLNGDAPRRRRRKKSLSRSIMRHA